MMTAYREQRPVFLNLLRIRFPVMAVLSIAHRVSGVFLFALLPVMIYLLGLSLQGPEGYAQVLALFEHRIVRLLAAVGLWAYVHHLLAGIRFLLLDVDVGIGLRPARISAWVVNVLGVAAFVLVLGRWW